MPLSVAILTTDKREHDQDYSNPSPSFGTAPEALLQGLALLPDVEVHVISCLQKSIPSPPKLENNIWYHGLHVPKIGWLRTGYQGCIRAVRKKLAAIQPDIVHGQGTERDCALNAVFSGFPNVLTIHGNMRLIARINRPRPFSFEWLAAVLERITLPKSNGIVCITRYTREAVADRVRQTWVVPNAVDASFFNLTDQRNLSEASVILCVGEVCSRKNQNAFIRALDPIAERRRISVVFLGGANKRWVHVQEFFDLLKSRPWCTYAGFANREKLKWYFQRATLLALPSLEDNCPMVVLEAMAAGVPVVAAKVGGVPDLIEEDKTGFFCDPLDAKSMTTAIERMLASPATIRERAKFAQQRAQERFHPLVIARSHLEIYREVLSRRS